MDANANLREYLGARELTGRYSSFDYCFNHFQGFRSDGRLDELAGADTLQLSCLHLGFYLASWGMLRGSSTLLQRSVRHFVPVVEVIAGSEPEVWEIDAHRYGDDEWALLRRTGGQIRAALPEGASDILVTKILLGVFGSVPAFDTYFKKGFGASTYGHRALRRVETFYRENEEVVEGHRVATLDFQSGEPSQFVYSRAKVIDMIFFVEGAP